MPDGAPAAPLDLPSLRLLCTQPVGEESVATLLQSAASTGEVIAAVRQPEVLLLVMRALADAALRIPPAKLTRTQGLIELAQAAATADDMLVLPATQHAALMLLLNLTRSADAAIAIAPLQPMLEKLTKSDDPRVRSLATTVLSNLSAHGGLLSRLTRPSKIRLQQVTPHVITETIRRLEIGVSSAPPPRTPQNSRIPVRAIDETSVNAIIASPAARAAVEAAEAQLARRAVAGRNGVAAAESPPLGDRPFQPAGVTGDGGEPATGAFSANGLEAIVAGNDATGGNSKALASGEGGAALSALRVMSQELHLVLGLAPVARATSAWGARKAGVVLSSIGGLLQRVPEGREWVVAAVLDRGDGARRLVTVHNAARADSDERAAEAALWCLACAAHVCGGRFARVDLPAHAVLLAGCLSSSTRLAERLCALAALRCAAADVLSVRLVARHIAAVQERLRSKSDEEVYLACAVVANVEQYSHARLWYARPGQPVTSLAPPPPPPPPPVVLYSQAVPPPEELEHAVSVLNVADDGVGRAPDVQPNRDHGPASRELASSCAWSGITRWMDGNDGMPARCYSDEVRHLPILACALHPWVRPSIRSAAAVRLANLLMQAWRRGVHDETLLYLLESSLVARRLAFALHSFSYMDDTAADGKPPSPSSPPGEIGPSFEVAAQACLFCLTMLPLLGGSGTLFTDAVLDRVLPLLGPPTATTHPDHSRLALLALQNASADSRAHRFLGTSRQKVIDALWRATALSYAPIADVALSTIANLAAVATASVAATDSARQAGYDDPAEPSEGNFALPTVVPISASISTVYRSAPPPLPLAPTSITPGAEGYRALPRLCVSLSTYAPGTATRRALSALIGLLDSASLEPSAALSLLAAYGGPERLVALVSSADVEAKSGSEVKCNEARVLLAAGALVCLGLIYRLGGSDLIKPHLGTLTAPAVSLLTSVEQTGRSAAAFFWQAATPMVEPASALAKATVPVARLSAAGISPPTAINGRNQTFTSGLGAMRRLAQASRGGILALWAAEAVAHVLQHRQTLSPLWTTTPDSLLYLERISPEEENELLALPNALREQAAEVSMLQSLANTAQS